MRKFFCYLGDFCQLGIFFQIGSLWPACFVVWLPETTSLSTTASTQRYIPRNLLRNFIDFSYIIRI